MDIKIEIIFIYIAFIYYYIKTMASMVESSHSLLPWLSNPDYSLIPIKSICNKDLVFRFKKDRQITAKKLIDYLINKEKYKFYESGIYYENTSDFTFRLDHNLLTDEQLNDPDFVKQIATMQLSRKQDESCKYTIADFTQKNESYKEIYVRTLTGKEILLFCDIENMTVSDLKCGILLNEGIPCDQQRVIYLGKQLEDDKLLSHYNICEKSIIHLVLRLRGGMFNEVSGRDGDYSELKSCIIDIEDD
jgi:hypothetical protein